MIDITLSREFTPKTSAVHHSSGVRVPLHELQMLTQSVATRDYVHAFGTISVSIAAINNDFKHAAICISQAAFGARPCFYAFVCA